ncbi:hypothetical protein L6164_022318 [Bauhinia variegata]|uniref:Uncharacterized protein n=1 Tax=Bauhinia variegata TaxID=167791 RepID=A0ACB9MGP0_BAUVA|nr:hypothetical protein L6164_022318 [Bauhinia variegata]
MEVDLQLCRFHGPEILELRIPDIIRRHGGPISLTQILAGISDAPSPDITCLERIMRVLVRKKIFSAQEASNSGDTLYGLTHSSRWLLTESGSEPSLAPLVVMENHPVRMAPWHYLSQCVREGGSAFVKAHGQDVWEFGLENPEFNKRFNEGMACTAKTVMSGVISGYKDGFDNIGSVVDVGGGTGQTISEIVKSYPHIKGINFDLPHVVAAAPKYEGVTNIGGDMFQEIPQADAVLMKWVLHDWSDEDCIKILNKCKKAIPEGRGKVIIVEIVLKPEGQGIFDYTGLVVDLNMLATCNGGRERTEPEWKKLLQEAGFPRYNIITVNALPSVIEAYPI